jgi:hypothetical protein
MRLSVFNRDLRFQQPHAAQRFLRQCVLVVRLGHPLGAMSKHVLACGAVACDRSQLSAKPSTACVGSVRALSWIELG